MKLLWYNSTPLAGMPWRTARVIRRYMENDEWCHSLTLRDRYGERVFPRDLLPGSPEADACLKTADLIVGGAYMQPPNSRHFVRHYSTEPQRWVDKSPAAGSATVVAQYQARFAPHLDVLPNCIPIDDPMFSPEPKPADRIVIVYTPTSRAKSGAQAWGSKGYEETMAALRYIANTRGRDVEIFVLENRPYEEVMRVRRRAHIVIDECATGSYHSTALEGLSCGCATVCYIDAKTEQALQRVLPTEALQFGLPFSLCPLVKLRGHLDMLTGNRDLLHYMGEAARDWMEKWYSERWQASMWINWHRSYLQRLESKGAKH